MHLLALVRHIFSVKKHIPEHIGMCLSVYLLVLFRTGVFQYNKGTTLVYVSFSRIWVLLQFMCLSVGLQGYTIEVLLWYMCRSVQ